MTKVFIIHGAHGSPQENWFPWLKSELEKLNCQVFVPALPTPDGQNLENWLAAFSPLLPELDNNSIFVGHSIGVAFILNVLEKLNRPIKASFLVAGFLGLLDLPEVDPINKTISNKNFDWLKILNNCPKFYCYGSDNDPYVPMAKVEELAQKLNTQVIVVPNAGHFNKAAGYIKFEKLLSDIKSTLD